MNEKGAWYIRISGLSFLPGNTFKLFCLAVS
jgi:hypothetical protein